MKVKFVKERRFRDTVYAVGQIVDLPESLYHKYVMLTGDAMAYDDGSEPEPAPAPVEAVEAADAPESETEVAPNAPAFSMVHRGGGYYDVLNASGTKVNDRPLKRLAAEKLLNELVEETS